MGKCHVCSFQNEPGAEYCEECGVRIGGAPPPVVVAPPPPVVAYVPPPPPPAPVAFEPPPAPAVAFEPPPSPPPRMAEPSPAPVPPPVSPQAIVIDMAPPVPVPVPVPAAPALHPTHPEGYQPGPAVSCPSCGTRVEGAVNFCPGCGTRLAGGAEVAPKPREVIRLRMVSGKDKDRLFEIDKNEVRLGRLNENDIRLEADGYVSGKHTRIVKQGDEYFVEDMGSTNGTFLRVRRLTKITPGDEVKVGQSIFRLE